LVKRRKKTKGVQDHGSLNPEGREGKKQEDFLQGKSPGDDGKGDVRNPTEKRFNQSPFKANGGGRFPSRKKEDPTVFPEWKE